MIPIPRGYRRLEWSEHKPARGTRLVESANPREKVSVTIRVRRRPDAPPRSRALDGESARAAPVPLMRGVRRPVRRGPCGLDQVGISPSGSASARRMWRAEVSASPARSGKWKRPSGWLCRRIHR